MTTIALYSAYGEFRFTTLSPPLKVVLYKAVLNSY
jgi:hypothetical protein